MLAPYGTQYRMLTVPYPTYLIAPKGRPDTSPRTQCGAEKTRAPTFFKKSLPTRVTSAPPTG